MTIHEFSCSSGSAADGRRDGTHRRSEVVAALSHALDITEGQPVGHAGRTCLIGMRIGERMGLSSRRLGALFYALLLKDAGCSSSAARMTEVFGGADDLELKRAAKLVDFSRTTATLRFVSDHTDSRGLRRTRDVIATALELARAGDEIVTSRCERGAAIVTRLGFPAATAAAVHALDERWDGQGRPLGLTGHRIPVLARIAAVAQHVDFFRAAAGVEAARGMVRSRRGSWFDPEVADAFLSIRDGDPLWRSLTLAHRPASLATYEPPDEVATLAEGDLDRIALAFADVIDAKSPYTANHSVGVARAALAIGRTLGCDVTELRSLNRAALLHDIGKLGVPNSILDKPGRLTDAERATVLLHPRYTEEILSRVSAFSPIAFVAGAHHERIDGRGYHRGLGAEHLPRDARILAVADVFDALHADRPYRRGMDVEQIVDIMRSDAGSAFDPLMVSALLTCIDELTDTAAAQEPRVLVA